MCGCLLLPSVFATLNRSGEGEALTIPAALYREKKYRRASSCLVTRLQKHRMRQPNWASKVKKNVRCERYWQFEALAMVSGIFIWNGYRCNRHTKAQWNKHCDVTIGCENEQGHNTGQGWGSTGQTRNWKKRTIAFSTLKHWLLFKITLKMNIMN